MSKIRFGILGGDYRYKILKDLLEKDGYSVYAYCNKYINDWTENIGILFEKSDVLIGPIPFTRDKRNVAFNDCKEKNIISFFADMVSNNINLLFCGVASDELKKQATDRFSITIYDFFALDEVAVKNAIPTAEGAIQTAMQESQKTIFGSKILVLGYGRCGKILSNMLKGIGADVTVTYRNTRDGAFIQAYGLNAIHLEEIKTSVYNYDFIFNTIPHEIITKDILKRMNRDTIVIDLAQAPGGVNYNYASELNIKALYCPGLPGRVAPFTAAQILKDTVINLTLSHFSL